MASDVLESHMGSWLINVRISELFQTLKMSFDLDKLLYILLNITGTPATLRTVSNALSPPKMLYCVSTWLLVYLTLSKARPEIKRVKNVIIKKSQCIVSKSGC